MALTLLSPLCLSGHYRLVYSHEAFFRFANGLHEKETTGLSLLELLFLQGGSGWWLAGTVLLSPVWGQVRVGTVRSLGSGIKMLRPPLTSCVALGKLVYFTEPPFLHLENGSNSTFQGLRGPVHVKNLVYS